MRGFFIYLENEVSESNDYHSDWGYCMRVLVCGSREWNDEAAIRREIQSRPVTVVIEGDCRGADRIAGKVARNLGIPVMEFPVTKEEWARIGKSAGNRRNSKMLEEGKPDLVLAFTPYLEGSRGTLDMVKKAMKAGVPVEIFNE